MFVTMTCNPSWREITENLPAGQKFYDRPDITSRVFRLKLKEIIQFFKLGKMGEVIAYLYSVEFQKRGLPHAHILIRSLDGQSIGSNRVDELICAEIPDIDADPELFAIVTRVVPRRVKLRRLVVVVKASRKPTPRKRDSRTVEDVFPSPVVGRFNKVAVPHSLGVNT